MKKIVALFVGATIVASASASFAGKGAATGVNGSFHDMNSYAQSVNGTRENYERVCVYCHTPHNAVVKDPNDPMGVNFLPLWNHDFSTLTYTAYNWATPDNTGLTIADPLVGPSRLCMSCHDGATAVDQHGPASPMTGGIKLSGNRAVGRGGDLTDDHPIGFDYIAAKNARNITQAGAGAPGSIAVKEIVPETEAFATNITNSLAGEQGAAKYNTVDRLGTRTIKSTLYNGSIMTCASCHEVHNKENATQAPAFNGFQTPNYFLYAKEQNSLICLSCHVK
jgi:cytochrome c553